MCLCYGKLHRVVWHKLTGFMGTYQLHHISLMMEEARTCETSFSVYKNTRRNISQNNRLHTCRRENLTSVTISVNLIKNGGPWGGQIQLGNYDFLVKKF
jgi:hypothetical protein